MTRRLAFFLLRRSGVPFLVRELVQRRRVTILCYHDPRPEDLERHLRALTRLYNVISLRRYLEARRSTGIRLPPKALILTFDDGHRGNYALKEVLARYRVPATVFLCSGIVGTNRRFWWTDLTPSERERLKRVPDAERRGSLASANAGRADARERQALSGDEIRELAALVDFQSHTRFHPVLPNCNDNDAMDEVGGSRRELESRFGIVARAFAYPNGDYSARDVELVRAAGYECALTIDGGFNTRTTDAFRLRRLPMLDSAGADELVVKASGIWELWRRSAPLGAAGKRIGRPGARRNKNESVATG